MSQDVFFHDPSEIQPSLNPPIHRWQEDMPENNHPQWVPPQLIWLNTKSDVWLEIPRYEGIVWGGMLICVFMVMSIIIFMTVMGFLIIQQVEDGGVFVIIYAAGDFLLASLMVMFIKIYSLEPRDKPIRLNKIRQKIYTFDYKRKGWNPWAKWPTTIRTYNWADIHGEMRFSSDRYTGGFQLFGSVCQPGTLNVIERFQIATGSPAQLHQIWSYLCLYMKGEPVPDEAVNPGRPDFWCPRKADKWPADMERESTTASETELPAAQDRINLSDRTGAV